MESRRRLPESVPRARLLASSVLLSALLVASRLAAQVPDTATVPADTLDAIPVAPVLVTVLRTPLTLPAVPYAVTVESAPRVGGPGLTLRERIGMAPGVQVDNRYAFSEGDRISVRGFGARSQFGVRGVKVLVDGIPATLPDGQTSLSHVDPWRVTRAEVLRGPASSLWGNAAGGVIRLETASTPLPGSSGGGTVMVGAHGLRRGAAEGAWSGNTGGIQASITAFSWDGFRSHAAADKLYGSMHGEWRRGRDALSVVAHGVDYTARAAGSLSAAQLTEDRFQAHPFNVVQAVGEAASQLQAGLTWRRAFGAGGPEHAGVPVLEVTAWGMGRSLDNPIPPVVIDLTRRAGGIRSSLRGTSPIADRVVTWVLGFDAEALRDDRLNFENDGGERGTRTLDQAERVSSVAPFVELAGRLAGPVRALAGLRWDGYRFSADDRLVSATNPDDSGSRTLSALSPSFGMVAELGAASVYGNVASSFETPTTTELVNRPDASGGFNPELDPQRALSVEAGMRGRLGRRAAVHAAAYRSRIHDALIPFEVPDAPGRSFFRNAGEAVHRGVELDAWAAPAEGVTVRASYAWTDARFVSFTTGTGEHSGNRVPGVAPHRAAASVAWKLRGGVRLELTERYVSSVPVDDANTAQAPAHALTSLNAASPPLRLGHGTLELFGGVGNLLDRQHISSVVVNAFGGRYYEPGPGRTGHIGIRVTAR